MPRLVKTSNGKSGGLLKGKSHKDGGIQAIVVDTNQPVELEGDEVIINKRSVKDPKKRSFTGTNKQVLSRINQLGGGVPIMEDGGYVKLHGGRVSNNQYRKIDDSQYSWNYQMEKIKSIWSSGKTCDLGDLIHHPLLFQHYNYLKKIKVKFENSIEHSADCNVPSIDDIKRDYEQCIITLRLNFDAYNENKPEFKTIESNEPDLARESMLLHELQHVLQKIHNRPCGTSRMGANKNADAQVAKAKAKKNDGQIPTVEEEFLLELSKNTNKYYLYQYFYYSDASEVEARQIVAEWLQSRGFTYIDPLKELFGITPVAFKSKASGGAVIHNADNIVFYKEENIQEPEFYKPAESKLEFYKKQETDPEFFKFYNNDNE